MYAGSEWRKWDLHLHIPGTRLSDGYTNKSRSNAVDKFCNILEESDVSVFGITDYFAVDRLIEVRQKFSALFPASKKTIMLNVELRLDVDVSTRGQNVNLHLLFNPEISDDKVRRFFSYLKTTIRNGEAGPSVTCADLSTETDFQNATVSVDAIREAIRQTFGDGAHSGHARRKSLLVLASAKGDGIRPASGTPGTGRRTSISKELDKFCDGFFGNAGNIAWYLDTGRFGDGSEAVPKPVFDGSDAHSFKQLESRLGQHSSGEGGAHTILWVKAEPTYDGLLQVFLEPATRVYLGATKPDQKVSYKTIEYIEFGEGSNFPPKIPLNPNLNSIIGSRSSGKSSLLAHIAYAVSPDAAVKAQLEVDPSVNTAQLGPAPGITWADAAKEGCRVHWASGQQGEGKVIYVPQNSLYTLSSRTDEITRRIAPAVSVARPSVGEQYDSLLARERNTDDVIRGAVGRCFDLLDRRQGLLDELNSLGNSKAVYAELEGLEIQIVELAVDADISPDDMERAKVIRQEVGQLEEILQGIEAELHWIAGLHRAANVSSGADGASNEHDYHIQFTFHSSPELTSVPFRLARDIESVASNYAVDLNSVARALVATRNDHLRARRSSVESRIRELQVEAQPFIERETAVSAIADLRLQAERLKTTARRVAVISDLLRENRRDLVNTAREIKLSIRSHLGEVDRFIQAVKADPIETEGMTLSAESGISDAFIRDQMAGIHGSSVNDYVVARGDLFNYAKAQESPLHFLWGLKSGEIRTIASARREEIGTRILTIRPTVRYTAELEGDTIGGFSPSSMTPGKQALFALSLTLGTDKDGWPLLLDQPEDDLDSRSIFSTIVAYLMAQKRKRQIIMVTHNANLAIGSDSEHILVANRHGSDHPNRGDRLFDYLSGSLESVRAPKPSARYALSRLDVPSHACEILDGGTEAFAKRSTRYLK